MSSKNAVKQNGSGSLWILPDQLCPDSETFQNLPREGSVIMIEPFEDAQKMHKKKLVFILSAMRHFRTELEKKGRQVDYYAVDDPDAKRGALCAKGYLACLRKHLLDYNVKRLLVSEPSEYELDHAVRSEYEKQLGIPVEIFPSCLFLISRKEFSLWEQAQSELVTENFYRLMRQSLKILMNGDEPEGERWNYDVENRVPPMGNMVFPPLPSPKPDPITRKVVQVVDKVFSKCRGNTDDFYLPVTRQQAVKWFDNFLENRIRLFGMYQDAMLMKEWYMYHSLISPLLNVGLLAPMEVVQRVERAYRNELTPLNSAEGFIRQVLGWREYINGIYWTNMPEYTRSNFFDHHNPIPRMLLDGKSRMSCIKEVVLQTENKGYAHHIQRLMIIGNFCLLTQIEPMQAVEWFTGAYVDSNQWAIIPNVLGMILFADGGYLGTKPYAASANYINKMSDYCRGCFYKARKRVGERACPFNFLYWYFLKKNVGLLKDNPRMGMVYNLLYRKTESELNLVVKSSEHFIGMMKDTGTDRKII